MDAMVYVVIKCDYTQLCPSMHKCEVYIEFFTPT